MERSSFKKTLEHHNEVLFESMLIIQDEENIGTFYWVFGVL